jgi:hypothetical protein
MLADGNFATRFTVGDIGLSPMAAIMMLDPPR